MKLSDFPEHVQEKIKRDNPGVFGRVAAVQAQESEPAAAPALDGGGAERERGEGGVGVGLAFILFSRRRLDSDNAIAALKPVRDAVCASLGLDDGDERIAFEYHQVQTRGAEGVCVKIELRRPGVYER